MGLGMSGAIFSFDQANGMPVCIPVHIITLIELADLDMGLLDHFPHVFGDAPGLYAMIEMLKQPLVARRTISCVVVEGTREQTNHTMACPLPHQIYVLSQLILFMSQLWQSHMRPVLMVSFSSFTLLTTTKDMGSHN